MRLFVPLLAAASLLAMSALPTAPASLAAQPQDAQAQAAAAQQAAVAALPQPVSLRPFATVDGPQLRLSDLFLGSSRAPTPWSPAPRRPASASRSMPCGSAASRAASA